MGRRVAKIALLLVLAVAVAAIATAPPDVSHVPATPSIAGDVDAWIAAREARVQETTPIISGAEKRVRWYGAQRGNRTEFAVVYLHGFSATRQEVAPVAEWVADRLGANLFETRLRGHGLAELPLASVTAEDWLDDGAEALAVGAAIGDRVVVIGTSTGATLALAIADHASFAAVSHVVLLSPNFAPADDSAEILTWPGGPQVARLLVGDTRSWTPANALQGRYWSTRYPMAAAVEMMRLVKLARSKLPLTLDQELLVFYSPQDAVVNTDRIIASYAEITAAKRQMVVIEGSGDPSNHVLAGDILAPENNERIAREIADFVRTSEL